MKKIVIMLVALSLLYWVRRPAFITAFTHHSPTAITNELVFVNVIRDLELLNSWLQHSYYPEETIAILRCQNHEKILALHGVDAQTFKESLKYYLEDSSERAFKVYKKVYLALEALSI